MISIFHKDVTLEEVLRYNYPYADGYRGFWENPIKVQHPLAISEIVAWDGSLTLLISKNNEFVNTLMKKMYLQNQPISGCYHYEQGYQNRETEGCRERFTFLRLRWFNCHPKACQGILLSMTTFELLRQLIGSEGMEEVKQAMGYK